MAAQVCIAALLLTAGFANGLIMNLRANHSDSAGRAQASLGVGLSIGSAVVQYNDKHGIIWARQGSDEPSSLEIIFVTDCSEHQRWLAYNVFSSAGQVGQDDPITWVRAGCDPEIAERGGRDLDVAAKIYPKARLFDVSGYWGKNFNTGGGVPGAMHRFLEAQQGLTNATTVALVEGDMIFLQKLRYDDEDLNTRGREMKGRSLVRSESGTLVGGKVGLAAHYDCCNDIGPPYLLSAQGWRDVTPVWNAKFQTSGWGGDQVALGQASIETGVDWNVYDHLMVSSYNKQPAWEMVEDALSVPEGDVCATKQVGMHPDLAKRNKDLPNFMHVVVPWSLETWGFSKYQVPPGWQMKTKTDGILQCAMPMFAEPPSDLLQGAGYTSKEEAGSTAKSDGDRRSGWAVCTILHSLNTMLANYKKVACDSFNEVKGLKMIVPLAWRNELLEGAYQGAPAGTDHEWLRMCATQPAC